MSNVINFDKFKPTDYSNNKGTKIGAISASKAIYYYTKKINQQKKTYTFESKFLTKIDIPFKNYELR